MFNTRSRREEIEQIKEARETVQELNQRLQHLTTQLQERERSLAVAEAARIAAETEANKWRTEFRQERDRGERQFKTLLNAIYPPPPPDAATPAMLGLGMKAGDLLHDATGLDTLSPDVLRSMPAFGRHGIRARAAVVAQAEAREKQAGEQEKVAQRDEDLTEEERAELRRSLKRPHEET